MHASGHMTHACIKTCPLIANAKRRVRPAGTHAVIRTARKCSIYAASASRMYACVTTLHAVACYQMLLPGPLHGEDAQLHGELGIKALRWRAERNLWISCCAFTLWG